MNTKSLVVAAVIAAMLIASGAARALDTTSAIIGEVSRMETCEELLAIAPGTDARKAMIGDTHELDSSNPEEASEVVSSAFHHLMMVLTAEVRIMNEYSLDEIWRKRWKGLGCGDRK